MSDMATLASRIRAGSRRALSAAITLTESGRRDHQDDAAELFGELTREGTREAVRIAISGTPGVGKSTIIDAFGTRLAEQGRTVAVLAVDPSSTRTGGSILGDKTRMGRLANCPGTFIRPSPTSTALGGVASQSREVVFLCEQAGFDFVLIETTGVGQSETGVSEFSDVFLLMIAPAGGDELQGVKRGIVEVADIIVVNKADGPLKESALATVAEYRSAIRLNANRRSDPEGFPMVVSASALEETGFDEIFGSISELVDWRKASGQWNSVRRGQEMRWMETHFRELLASRIRASEHVQGRIRRIGQEIDPAATMFSPQVRGELERLADETIAGIRDSGTADRR